MGYKYIVLELTENGMTREIPVIFPDVFVHADVAQKMRETEGFVNAKPIAAGSIELSAYSCSGNSETLGLASRGEVDERLINSFPYFHGLV